MIRFAIISIVLCSVGCSFEHPFHGDTRFTAEERLAVEESNRFTAAKTGNEAQEIIWDATVTADEKCSADYQIVKRHGGSGGFCNGKCIYVDVTDISRMKAVASHEFGHWSGLAHIKAEEEGLMNPSGAAEPIWTAADEANCNRQPSGVCKLHQ